ncbi:hypothetical protein [Kribbella amoyensis]|uniref:hypothetical protein n=1 Tax=Kribbella amoyensis TaxID=996641 RepID=UPI0011A0053A|nr:hypothetical protein [Kribbella amoyensis]
MNGVRRFAPDGSRQDGSVTEPVAEFGRVVREVLVTAHETCGVEAREPGLERAPSILQANPGLRGQAEGRLIALLESPQDGVVELLSFLMHVLRWEAVQEAVGNRLTSPRGDVSHIRLSEAIWDSFSDTWRDRDLFRRFADR